MVGAEDEKQALGSLPTRLRDWRLSPDQKTMAYGGDEVDLSVWDTERAFGSANPSPHSGAAPSIESKRKRDALFPGEIWRAKNVPADGLGLRQGVSITSLTFLTPSTALPENRHLLTGTQFGDVRRYDTRSRRPVSNWKNIGKMGGVKVMKKGLAEQYACSTNI
jgi:ribosome biogenesis protein NSA1